tara:strand:+ start:508 stop:1038 length:531 start_codon:yes stop_codon:yes gene_type:complete
MGHYKKDGPHMESAKQERKNLLRDNPVVRDMDSSRPWMSKHFKSSMSPLKDMHGSPAEKELVGNQGNLPQHLQDEIKAAPEMREGMHMNYDSGINNNHPDMLSSMGKKLGEIGAESLKMNKEMGEVPKGNMKQFLVNLNKNAADEASEESSQSLSDNEIKREGGKPLTKGGKPKEK